MKKKSFPVLSEKIIARQFGNGLRAYVFPRHQSAAVAMQAWIATGSIHEGKYLGCGLSHFLEHMLFQGTREYPGNTIAEKIAACGGDLNAATSSEYTCAYFNLPPENLAEGIAMLDSMVREPLFPDGQFESERSVILRELAMYKDSPIQNLFETLRMNLLRLHPLRYPTGGFPEKLAEVTPEIMREYHRLRYTPDRTFYVIVGDVQPEKVFGLLEKRTGNWARGCMEEPVLPQEPPCVFKRNVRIEFPAPQAYYAAGWLTPGAVHPDFIAVNAFSDILGNGDSSRLYEELVNRRMLAQDILFYSHALTSAGYSGAAAIAEPEKMHELAGRTFDILQKFIQEGPDDEELECFRCNQETDYLQILQTNERIAHLVGKSVLQHGSPDALDCYLPAVDRLDREELIRVGRKYFLQNAFTAVEQFPAGTLLSRKKQSAEAVRHIPKLKKFKSGQRLLFLEDHSLPLVSFAILLPGGILHESRQQAGLTRLLAETLDSGCAKYTEAEFDRQLELNAVDLDIEAGASALTITVTCPAEKMSKAMELISEMLHSPLFPASAVRRERENLVSDLKTTLMKPEKAARDSACSHLFGKHPFGTSGGEVLKNLERIKPASLRHFYESVCLSPSQAVFGFSGDLTEKDAEKWTGRIIRACTWNRYRRPVFPTPVFPGRDLHFSLALPRQQAVVFTVLPGVRSGTPEALVTNLVRIDASSMASRLFQTVRNENGLVYYAHFVGRSGFGFDGYMGFCGATAENGTAALENIFRDQIKHLASHGLTRAEFENARKMLLFQLENLSQSPEELLAGLVSSEFTGAGWKYFWDRREVLRSLTYAGFNRTLKKLFSGKNAVTTVVLPEPQKEQDSHENR